MKYIIGIITVILLIGLLYMMKGTSAFDLSTYGQTPIKTVASLQYGDNQMKIGETAYFPDISIKPVRVAEDSRCPAKVQCIWAGTVRVEFQISSAMGTSTAVLALGEALTTEAETIIFKEASPSKTAQSNISEDQYRFLVNVSK